MALVPSHPLLLSMAAAVLFLTSGAGTARISPAAMPQLQRQGIYEELALPPGSTDVLLSREGRWASLCAVTFNPGRSEPERLITVVDVNASRVAWQMALDSPSCCAFPVLSMTPAGDVIAVGGAEQTILYTRTGVPIFTATLDDGRLHSAVGITDDGNLLVIGEWEGRVAAFARGRAKPLWVQDIGPDLMALAVSGDGEAVVAALRAGLMVFRSRDGAVLVNNSYGPARIAMVAVSRDGSRAGLVWKRQDERMILQYVAQGRTVWTRELDVGTVPLLQMDDGGRWLAVGDLLGKQAALYSFRGEKVWDAGRSARVAVAVAPDGSHAAMAEGPSLEVRLLPSGQSIWRNHLPGVGHAMRIAGGTVAVLGSMKSEGLPDRIWFGNIGRPR